MLLSVQRFESQTCFGTDFQLNYPISAISSSVISDACRSGARFKVSVLPGQTMNITVLDFNTRYSSVFGTITDARSGNEEEVKGGERFQQLMTTVGNRIVIDFNHEAPTGTNMLILIQSQYIKFKSIVLMNGVKAFQSILIIDTGHISCAKARHDVVLIFSVQHWAALICHRRTVPG